MTPKSLRTGKKQGTRKRPTQKQLEALKPTQFQPGESGNPGGRPKRVFSDMLIDEIMRTVPNSKDGLQVIRVIARQLVAKAAKGDLASIRELADRIEGKPPQSIALGGPDGGAIPWASYIDRDANERRIAELEAMARMIDPCAAQLELAEKPTFQALRRLNSDMPICRC